MTLRDSPSRQLAPLRWWLSVLNAGMPPHVVAPQRVTQRLLKLWRRRDAEAALLVVETDDKGLPLALRALA